MYKYAYARKFFFLVLKLVIHCKILIRKNNTFTLHGGVCNRSFSKNVLKIRQTFKKKNLSKVNFRHYLYKRWSNCLFWRYVSLTFLLYRCFLLYIYFIALTKKKKKKLQELHDPLAHLFSISCSINTSIEKCKKWTIGFITLLRKNTSIMKSNQMSDWVIKFPTTNSLITGTFIYYRSIHSDEYIKLMYSVEIFPFQVTSQSAAKNFSSKSQHIADRT